MQTEDPDKAREKARKEAQRLAEEEIQREHAKRLEQEEQQKSEREQVILEQLEALRVGASVVFHHQDKDQKAKLAAHIHASEHFIFVDFQGRKIAEHNHQELLEKMTSNTLSITQNSDEFESQLAKVVSSLQNKAQH